ncbi:MAG: hypothetical protein HY762_04105 [Planctomycetes bacterium]|nr:hypothetical protein [Planctomycetota bacterium]
MATMKTRIIHMHLLLLDADVIIDLHRFDLWDKICANNNVYVASTIINEVKGFDDDSGRWQNIDLISQVGNTIQTIDSTLQEIHQIESKFNKAYLEIHKGESESLAILLKTPNMVFCTCDNAAVQALVLLDISNRGISVETMLKQSGISFSHLESKHTEKRFKIYIQQGQQKKIQGIGLNI